MLNSEKSYARTKELFSAFCLSIYFKWDQCLTTHYPQIKPISTTPPQLVSDIYLLCIIAHCTNDTVFHCWLIDHIHHFWFLKWICLYFQLLQKFSFCICLFYSDWSYRWISNTKTVVCSIEFKMQIFLYAGLYYAVVCYRFQKDTLIAIPRL